MDDDEGVRRLLAYELAPIGVRVLEAADGRSAIEIAVAERPGAVLLDVLMPGPDGWETLRSLKQRPETRNIPVIMLSVVENRAFGLSLGAFDYLVKPLDVSKIMDSLSRAGVLASQGHLLVVDDDADVRQLLAQELAAAGYRVLGVEGGAEALAAMEQEKPSGVVLDLMMKPPDGFEVLCRMREDPELAEIPVVVVTAKELTEADYKALRGSAQRVVRKGSDPIAVDRRGASGGEGREDRVKARILVVEDSPDIRVLIRMLLEAAGHEVMTASDGRAGVEAVRAERPDLVLMDLSLPVLSGWEAAKEIKEDPATASIPIVAVTAHAMHGDRERALAAGCDGFIPKPIDEETFETLVRSYLRRPAPGRSGDLGDGAATGVPPPRRARPRPAASSSSTTTRRSPTSSDTTWRAKATKSSSRGPRNRWPSSRRATGGSTSPIVDVMLGPDSGYDLTADLVSRATEYLPVLLVTAGEIDREKGFAAGADDFIAKPLDATELVARARSLIRVGRAIRSQGRAARERSEAYEKLAELDRLKSDFLSTVSHELRTPLNTIILLSHLIEREGKTPADEERRLHDIRVIRESAETLLRMINNILDLAKLEAGQRDLHPQRVALRPMLEETADLLEPQARARDLTLTTDMSPDLPETAVLDREKVSRVLINLLSNAVKYTRKGRVVLRASAWQESIAFEVEDTGSGVPANLVGTVFEPFRQIRTGNEEVPRGTGLGLTISKQLVELMGGDLIFDSREGKGTRVAFTLPQLEAAEVAPAPAAPTIAAEPGESGKGRRVLVVEDDAFSRYGLKSLLESEGYEVTEAGTLAEAEDSARRTPSRHRDPGHHAAGRRRRGVAPARRKARREGRVPGHRAHRNHRGRRHEADRAVGSLLDTPEAGERRPPLRGAAGLPGGAGAGGRESVTPRPGRPAA